MSGEMNPIFRKTLILAEAATIIAVIAGILVPFDHGIWLVAYLLLVGTLAQYLLVRGQMSLVSYVHQRVAIVEASLWAAGVLLVPMGVLIGFRLLVGIGSFALLAALLVFWMNVRPVISPKLTSGASLEVVAYLGLLVFMTVSVFVGMGLSSDLPWL